MYEEFINYLWSHQLMGLDLVSTSGEKLTIIKTGHRNYDSGPDFLNARVKIGDTIWAGNVEVHVKASDWYRHKHNLNPDYENIILHVVHENDQPALRFSKEMIPTLEVKNRYKEFMLKRYTSFIESKRWIACDRMIHHINYFDQLNWFDRLMVERLEQKAKQISEELLSSQQDFREIFYRKLCRNFGFNTNADAFEQMAKSLPLKILSKHSRNLSQLEALLYGQAGLLECNFKDAFPQQLKKEYRFLAHKYDLRPLNKKLFKFMRMRPANFPSVRLSQLAALIFKSEAMLQEILSLKSLNEVIGLFQVNASEYWDNHYRFDTIIRQRKRKVLGLSSIDLILINTIVPFLFVYGQYKNDDGLKEKAIHWLGQIKAESNAISRNFKALGVNPLNAFHSQALIQLKHGYCDQNRCLDCRFGHILLSEPNFNSI